ncbi:MAG TPA: isochorismatase family cysteine hydrolase [Bacteroidia bacterium]|jgi:nicotinamidase-related amidase|nr:isochorismatase family cysteine hydrolase [Bacteroidia bacterium]
MEQNTNNTALLVMDIQQFTIGMLQGGEAYLAILSKAIENARAKKIPVIYVVIGFREGYPEISQSNKSFARIKNTPGLRFDTEEAMKVHAALAPVKGDITVIKKRVSAFSGSDLEIVLRSMGIKHIILTGIATSGVVLSTLREAADKDYTSTVLSDCCADMDEEVHRVLTTKVFSRQADVLTSEEWSKI